MPPMYTNNQYGHRDHLGNIREVLDANGAVCQYTDYYAFGAPFCMPGTYMGASLQPYKFNGKELDLMHGLNTYDYGARQYYPVVPVWDRMDPLCEKYYGVSPYAYCHNNPIMRVDPNGMDDYFNNRGIFLYSKGTGSNMLIQNRNGFSNLSTYNLRNKSNMQIAANVVGHYARKVGIKYNQNGGKGTVGVGTMHDTDNEGRVLAGTKDGNIYIKVTNGHLDEYMYDFNQLMGTLRHENEHKKDQQIRNRKASDIRHAEIILTEIRSNEFSKSSKEYQNAQIEMFRHYIKKVDKKNSQEKKNILLQFHRLGY